ncbi:MAG: response regulator transcription factor [Enterocloster asparagiformis]|nr:response regulator transcription factor [Enterocloster asparagiformis]
MIKVVIADDIQILRQGLKAILEQDEDIEVTGLAGDGLQAFLLCEEARPDVVLMDMRMPEYDGAYGIRRIKEELPGIKILVLTTFDDRETVEAALGSGADGYILKEMDDDAVIRSVKAVCAGVRVFGDSVFRSMQEFTPARPEPRPGAFSLTERERDIMRLVAQGMDNREIARTLYLAEGTVRNNLSRILEKLELKDRTQLAVFAVKNNLD